jgi:hypothetical protein
VLELIVGEVMVIAGETGSCVTINAGLTAQIASSPTHRAVSLALTGHSRSVESSLRSILHMSAPINKGHTACASGRVIDALDQ